MWQDFPELLSKLQFDDKPAGGSLVIIHKDKTVVNTAIGRQRSVGNADGGAGLKGAARL